MGGAPRPGSVVGTIRFERKLDAGGFAEVWLGRDDALDRSVALKVLRSDLSVSDPTEYTDRRVRLEREAKLLARFDHENIVKIYGLLDLGGASVALVMEYVTVPTLREFIAVRGGEASWREAVEVALGAARALDYMHSPPRQMVHRDIKPGNLFWRAGEIVKVADFGVAQVAAEHTRTPRSIRDHPGTPLYMSPEQRDRSPFLDGRSDEYSLAQCLYEMVAGHVYSETYPSLDTERQDLPPHFVAALHKALSRRREDRFSTCGEFARALATSGVAPTLDPELVPPMRPATTVRVLPRPHPVRPLVAAAAAIGLAAVGTIAAAGTGMFSSAVAVSSPTTPPTATTPAPTTTRLSSAAATPTPTAPPTTAPTSAAATPTVEPRTETPAPTAPPAPRPTPQPTAASVAPPPPSATVTLSVQLPDGTRIFYTGPSSVQQGAVFSATFNVLLGDGTPGGDQLVVYVGGGNSSAPAVATPVGSGRYTANVPVAAPVGQQPLNVVYGNNPATYTIGTIVVR